MIGVQADTTGILTATALTLRRLGQLTGFSQKTVLRGFAGVVLKTWAGRTKVSNTKQAEMAGRARALYSITNKGKAAATSGYMTINSGRRGGIPGWMWYRTKNNKFQTAGFMDPNGASYRWANIHFNDDDWRAMSAAAQKAASSLAVMIPRAKASVGFSRQSVVQIADALGIDLARVQGGGTLSAAGLAKARSALASTGKAYRNGFGYEGGTRTGDYIDLINRLPYGDKLGMDRTLLSVLNGQNKYFERSYAKGAFTSQLYATRAYPNLFSFRSNLS